MRLRFAILAATALAACSGGGNSGPTIPPPGTPVLSAVAISGLTTVSVGQGIQLTASPRDQNGNSISAIVTWSTSAPAVATVSSSGLLSGAAAGSATITASATAGATTVVASTVVTVTASGNPVLTSITIGGGNIVGVGQTLLLSAAAKDQNGNSIGATITWSSSATGVATVNSGLVAGIAPGVALITAASGNVSSSAASVTVTASGGGFPLSVDVNMPGNTFSPFSVDLARGGVVRYIFPGVAHNVIYDNVSGKPADILVTTNQTVVRTFSVTGTFPYSCTIHPGMVGQVVVR